MVPHTAHPCTGHVARAVWQPWPRLPAVLWAMALTAAAAPAGAPPPPPAPPGGPPGPPPAGPGPPGPAPRPDPLDARSVVPPSVHSSALASFRRFVEVPVGSWREANETVTRIGGWRAYTREANQPEAPASSPGQRKHRDPPSK